MPRRTTRCQPVADMTALPPAPRRDALDQSGVVILVGLVRLVAVVSVTLGLAETVAGIAFNEPRSGDLGVVSVAYGLWLASRIGRLRGPELERTMTWIATATLGIIAVAALLQPSIATAMAIASLLPGVIVT